MSPRAARGLAWSLWSIFAVSITTAAVLGTTADAPGFDGSIAGGLALIFAFGAYATVGAIVASRRPTNAVGWLFCAIGALVGFGALSQVYAHYALAVAAARAPLGVGAAWVASWYWYPLLGMTIMMPLLLFPTGGPPSRGWRPVVWFAWAGIAAVTVLAAVAERLNGETYSVANPVGIRGLGVIEETTAGSVLLGVLFANLILGLVSVVVRFRRSTGVERQQLKWFTYAAAIVVVYEIVGEMWSPLGSWGGDFMFAAVIALIPIACGMAILRYRLYDIDRVINRTLVYAALSAVLAGVYALCVVVLPALVGAGSESDLVVAGSTLLVAALFGPARRRIQGFIDRRFYRSRYDAQRTVEAFGTRLRHEVQLEEVRSELLGVVRGTLQPRQVSLWLPPRGRA